MRALAVVLAVPLLLPLSSYAESAPTSSDSADQLEARKRQFVSSFRDNVKRGCLSSSADKTDRPSLAAYCECYAGSFVDRYSPEQLVAISNIASQNKDYAEIVTFMMRPESSACKSK